MTKQRSKIHARSGAMPITFLLATGLLLGGCGLPPGQALEAMRTMFEPRGKNAMMAWDSTMTGGSSQTDQNKAFQAGENLPPTPKTLYAAARMLAAQGRDAECKSMLKGILAEHPRMMPAYCDLAELQIRQRRIEEAVQTLSVGLRVAPRDALLLNNLGMCRMLVGEHQLALNAFTEAAGIEPHDARYRANMAVVLGMMGRYEESLALYRQIVPLEDARHNVAVLRRARDQLSPTSDQQNVGLDAAGSLSSALTKAHANLSVEVPHLAIASASPRTVESSSIDSADQLDKQEVVASKLEPSHGHTDDELPPSPVADARTMSNPLDIPAASWDPELIGAAVVYLHEMISKWVPSVQDYLATPRIARAENRIVVEGDLSQITPSN